MTITSKTFNHSKKIENGSLTRIFKNIISMLSSQVLNRASTFVLYVLVGRYLGTYIFGQMSLALTLFYTFQVFAVAGLRTLITREVAKDRLKTNQYLSNGSTAVLLFSIVSIILLIIFVWLMNYGRDTALIIMFLSLALIPFALSNICEAIFQGWERMQYIAYANLPANLLKVVLVYIMLVHDKNIHYVIATILISHIAILAIEWFFILKNIAKPKLRIDIAFSIKMVKSTLSFLGIDGVIAIHASLCTLLLSKFATEVEVGLFSAASQLMVPLMLIYQSIVISIFPVMCQKFDRGREFLKKISDDLIEFLFAIALPTAVGLFFLSEFIFTLIYKDINFLSAVPAFNIMIWGMIARAVTHVLGHILWAGRREKTTLNIIIINTILTFFIGIVLVSKYDLMGAAITILFSQIIDFIQHYIAVKNLLLNLNLKKLIWKPALAGILMSFCIMLIKNQNFLIIIASGSIVYITALFILLIWAYKGLQQLKAKYAYLWS